MRSPKEIIKNRKDDVRLRLKYNTTYYVNVVVTEYIESRIKKIPFHIIYNKLNDFLVAETWRSVDLR